MHTSILLRCLPTVNYSENALSQNYKRKNNIMWFFPHITLEDNFRENCKLLHPYYFIIFFKNMTCFRELYNLFAASLPLHI